MDALDDLIAQAALEQDAGQRGDRDAADAAEIRGDFEEPWITWNTIRTATNAASFAAAVVALAV